MNPYDVLELPAGASREDVKRAFHRLAHIYHPDKPTGDAEKFKKISAAYSILKDRAPATTSHPDNAARSNPTVVVWSFHDMDGSFWTSTQQDMRAQQEAIDRMFAQMKAQQRWWGSTGTS